jgi:hypothetical protein
VVRVLVGQRKGDRFPGFWAEFEGREISSYTDTRAEKHILYTLYRCTAYRWEAYRVHIADEGNPANPVSTNYCPSRKVHTPEVLTSIIRRRGAGIR